MLVSNWYVSQVIYKDILLIVFNLNAFLFIESYFRKIVYPLMGGALVGGAFYISVPENQTDAYRRIQELIRRVWPK